MKNKYLITLIGKNPLPNYYTILNYSDRTDVIFAVYTQDTGTAISSKIMCDNIEKAIRKKSLDTEMIKIPCDKSSFMNIKKTAEKIMEDILSMSDYDNIGSGTVSIILDHTGATKAMSAVFFDYFNDLEAKQIYQNIKIYSSYTAAESGEIYNNDLSSHKNASQHKLTEVIEKYNITPEDIVEVHGFKLFRFDDHVEVLYNDQFGVEQKYSFRDIYIKEHYIWFRVEKSFICKKEIRDYYFELSRWAEKVGGSEARMEIVYELTGEKKETYECIKDYFFNALKGTYAKDLRGKVSLIQR